MPRRRIVPAIYFLGPGSSGPAPNPPTLDAIANPLLFPEAGGGVAVTLSGTNLATVTLVNVGPSSIAPSGTTSGSVTFTWPAVAASATAYDISVASSGGTSNTLSHAAYALPAPIANCWYTAEGFNSGTGAWVDLIGGLTGTVFPGLAKPTLTPSWSNGAPSTTYAGGQGLLVPSLAAPISTGEVLWVGDATTLGELLFDTGDGTPAIRWAAYTSALGVPYAPGIYANAGFFEDDLVTLGSPCYVEFIFNGASSAIILNGGTPGTGATGDATIQASFAIGCNFAGANGMTGHIAMIAVCDSLLSGTQSGIWEGIAAAIYGI